MLEIWRDIDGYEGLYQVSSLGKVKSLKCGKERILKAGINGGGYLQVVLCKDGKQKHYLVHRLVALAFIPNTYNLPQVNHIDEDKTNNIVENLEWCSVEYNINYGTRNKRVSESNGKKVLCVETNKIYPSTLQIEREIGFNQGCIASACTGKRKTAYGFHWRYIN